MFTLFFFFILSVFSYDQNFVLLLFFDFHFALKINSGKSVVLPRFFRTHLVVVSLSVVSCHALCFYCHVFFIYFHFMEFYAFLYLLIIIIIIIEVEEGEKEEEENAFDSLHISIIRSVCFGFYFVILFCFFMLCFT